MPKDGADDTFDESQASHHTWTGEEPLPPKDGPGTAPPPPDGRARGSRYRAVGNIGKGAIGVVKSVYDEELGRTVAYKQLKDGKNPALVARFLREARITAQLDHPGIVAVHELGVQPDGARYYTMRLVKGDTLEQRLKGCKSLSDRLALLGHFVDLCQAIGFAHSRGVVHRDLKPANVMVGEHGETQILDWGLAKEKGETHERDEDISRIRGASMQATKDSGATVMGTVLGTPSYMSPEQANGDVQAIDARSDVWSLGVMLFELLAGQRPFDGQDPWDVVARVRRNEHKPLSSFERNAPPELAAIAERAMSLHPAERYPTGAELAADVDAWMTGGRVSAFRYSWRDEAQRFVQRWRAPLAVAVVLGAVLVVGAAVAFVQIVDQRDRAVSAEQIANNNLAELYAERAVERLEAGRNAEAALFAATSLALRENPDARGVLLAADAQWPRLVRSVPQSCTDAAISGDRFINCATGGSLVRVDTTDGSAVKLYEQPVSYVEAYPDGSVTAWAPGGALWRTDPNGITTRHDFPHALTSVYVSSEGTLAWIGGPNVYFVGEGLPDVIKTEGTSNAIVYDPAWGWLVSSGARGILTLAEGATAFGVLPGTEPYMVRAMAVEPDGAAHLAFGTADGTALVRAADGTITPLPSHRGAITDVTYATPALVATVGEDSLLAFSSPDGRLLGRIGAPASTGLLRLSDGRLVTYDPNDKAMRVWDVSALAERSDIVGASGEGQSTAALASDGAFVAFFGTGLVRRYDPQGALTGAASAGPGVIKAGGVGSDFVAAGLSADDLVILDLPELTERWRIPGRGVIGLDVTPDGEVIASLRNMTDTEGGGGVIAVNARTGETRVLHTGDIPRDIDTLGDLIAFVGDAGQTIVLDRTGKELARGNVDAREVAFLDRDHLLLSSETGTVTRWTWRDNVVEETFLGNEWRHGAPIDGIAVSPDGALVATASWDRSVGLWDGRTGALRAVLHGHDHRVADVSFSPDGRYLLSSSWDGTARRWTLSELTRDPASVIADVRDQVGLTVEEGKVVAR